MSKVLAENDFENVLERLGAFGRWQWEISLLTAYLALVVGSYMQGYNFIGAELEHWCKVPQLDAIANWTNEEKREFAAFGVADVQKSCYIADRDYSAYEGVSYSDALTSLDVSNNVSLLKCEDSSNQWHYYSEHYGLTVQNQWNLVCSNSFWVPTTQSILMVGTMVGLWVFGHLADRFGRRTIVVWCTIPYLVLACGTALAPSYWVFGLCRLAQGIFSAGLYTTCFILNMEIVVARHRDVVGFMIQITWGIVLFFPVALFGYFIRDWRYLQLAFGIFSLPCLLFYWLLPESPRWLILHNRLAEAEKIIRHAAVKNNVTLPDDLGLDRIRQHHVGKGAISRGGAHFGALFKTKQLRNRTIALIIDWIIVAFVAYGITFYGKSVSGTPYLALTGMGISKSLAHIAGVYIFKWFGRRKPMAFMFALTAVCCIFVLLGLHLENQNLVMSMSVIGIGSASGAFDGIYIYTAEIYPTYVRNVGITTCSMLARIGSILAPYAAFQSKDDSNWWLPSTVFALAAAIGAVVMMFLPEMAGVDLPETVNDAENIESSIHKNPRGHSFGAKHGLGLLNSSNTESAAPLTEANGRLSLDPSDEDSDGDASSGAAHLQ